MKNIISRLLFVLFTVVAVIVPSASHLVKYAPSALPSASSVAGRLPVGMKGYVPVTTVATPSIGTVQTSKISTADMLKHVQPVKVKPQITPKIQLAQGFRAPSSGMFRGSRPLMMSYQQAAQTIGVKSDASQEEIKKAFKREVMKHHPDRGGSVKRMQEINQAYEILKKDPGQSSSSDHGEEEKRKAAEEAYRKEREESRKAAEEASRKAAEEAYRKAAEEAAAEEAYRKEREESRKAAEEAYRKVTEKVYRTQREARKAEEELRKRSEELRRKAEEIRRKGEEESRKRKEQEKKFLIGLGVPSAITAGSIAGLKGYILYKELTEKQDQDEQEFEKAIKGSDIETLNNLFEQGKLSNYDLEQGFQLAKKEENKEIIKWFNEKKNWGRVIKEFFGRTIVGVGWNNPHYKDNQ